MTYMSTCFVGIVQNRAAMSRHFRQSESTKYQGDVGLKVGSAARQFGGFAAELG